MFEESDIIEIFNNYDLDNDGLLNITEFSNIILIIDYKM
jgi:Ca2+-binding EF-hand superfamily protein